MPQVSAEVFFEARQCVVCTRVATHHETTFSVSRTRKLPRSQGHAVVVEHAFATAARRLDLLDLVTAGDYTGPAPVFTAEWSALFERLAR